MSCEIGELGKQKYENGAHSCHVIRFHKFTTCWRVRTEGQSSRSAIMGKKILWKVETEKRKNYLNFEPGSKNVV